MYGDRPRVTQQEFEHHILPALSNGHQLQNGHVVHLTEHELHKIKTVFEPYFIADPSRPSWKEGVDEHQLKAIMDTHLKDPSALGIDAHRLGAVNEVMLNYIHKRT